MNRRRVKYFLTSLILASLGLLLTQAAVSDVHASSSATKNIRHYSANGIAGITLNVSVAGGATIACGTVGAGVEQCVQNSPSSVTWTAVDLFHQWEGAGWFQTMRPVLTGECGVVYQATIQTVSADDDLGNPLTYPMLYPHWRVC